MRDLSQTERIFCLKLMSDGPSTRNMSDDGEDDIAAAVTVVFSALNDKI